MLTLTRYLLYQVTWSVDILFINIIENRISPMVGQDIELIKLVLSFYERYDVNHKNVPSYYIAKALYDVALSVVLDPQNTLQDPLDTALNGLTLVTERPSGVAGYAGVPTVQGATEQDNWEGIYHSSHNWLSAGVLHTVDWSLPPTTDI